MAGTKHIRPDDKNAGPLRLGAGRRCGLLADGLGGWRLLAFLGAGDAMRKDRRRGDGLPGIAGAGNGPAAICGCDSAVFNQLLTTFLVVAMVLWLTVFFLCSYCLFRRWLGRFRFPGAGVVVGGPVVVWEELSTGTIKGGGSGKRTGVFLRWGKIYFPTSSTPLSDLGGSGKQGHSLYQPAAENDQEAYPGF